MSLAEEQAAFLRLATNAADQEAFFRDPIGTGAAWGLAPDIAAQLQSREAEIRRFGRSLRNKRRKEVGSLVPRLERALGSEYSGWFDRYCRECPGAGQLARDNEALSFARFVARHLNLPAARYDAAALETRDPARHLIF